jgi:FkbM family methyltransferase
MRNGVFVDVGAFNGVDLSNSLFFEEDLGWTGICIEPDPETYLSLCANRPCAHNLCLAASDAPGTREFIRANELGGFRGTTDEARINRENMFVGRTNVVTEPLRTILADAAVDEVHYVSIDVEGAEIEVLRGIDFEAAAIHSMTIECNAQIDRERLVASVGPQHIFAGQYQWDLFFVLRDGPFAPHAPDLIAAIEELNRPRPPALSRWMRSIFGR